MIRLKVSSRRLGWPASSLLSTQIHSVPLILSIPLQSHRSIFGFSRKGRSSRYAAPIDPHALEFLKRSPSTKPPPTITRGDLAPSSIFEDPSSKASLTKRPSTRQPARDPAAMAAALDPTPLARARWERKQVIRSIRGRNRLNKTLQIKRTEREHLSKSHMLKTSVKKLGPLARQIAGKPIEDAIVQMRFSGKKAARSVRRHLEYARDEAIVRRGMGLGLVQKQSEMESEDGKSEIDGHGQGLLVEDKKGKRRFVRDDSEIYVDQAWVGRGKYGTALDYRARGRVNVMRLPYTSISVVLKEEATRIRHMQEREQKRQRKKVWVPLPDRPITAQRQYCLW